MKKGKRFSSTYQPANRGRRPDIIKKLKGYGCSESDIKRLLEEIVFKDKKGAEDLLRDVDLPIIGQCNRHPSGDNIRGQPGGGRWPVTG